MAPLAQIPYMQLMTAFALQEFFRNDSVFDLVWCAPLAGQQRVLREMPPQVVAQVLWTAIDLPFSQDVKAEMVEEENSAWSTSTARPAR